MGVFVRFWVALFGMPLCLFSLFGCGSSGPIEAAGTGSDSVLGHWFLDRGDGRFVLTVGLSSDQLVGNLAPEESPDATSSIEIAEWNEHTGHLQFRATEDGKWFWYVAELTQGVLRGRYAQSQEGPSAPPPGVAYDRHHVVGWRSESFDTDIVPRVYDIVIDHEEFAKLRIDRDTTDLSEFVGEMKIYATASAGSEGELPARNVLVTQWDGQHLAFETASRTGHRLFSGTVADRSIAGSVVVEGSGETQGFQGKRSDVLAYGLSGKSADAREEWQIANRGRLFRLMMAGNPDPTSSNVEVSEYRPASPGPVPPYRDDNAGNWPQDYRLQEVKFTYTLPNPYGSDPLVRRSHGFLASPLAPPPAGGYPMVLALNGHGGSGWDSFQPWSGYWYADAFARRGYVVLALDVSHRPPSDTGGLYVDEPDGDDPEGGNHAHPAIAAPGLDSDWTENGERVWDAMRAIDYLLTRPNGNASSLVVTGLSMGGEVSDLVGALDPRVYVTIPAGAPADLSLMRQHGGHNCWEWVQADVTEFVDVSDYIAMVAPRPLIRMAGKIDPLYSSFSVPFAVEKEVVRRGGVAFSEDPTTLVHYLHDDGHAYHAGDVSDDTPHPLGLSVPVRAAPRGWTDESVDWAEDGETVSLNQSLFDRVGSVMPHSPPSPAPPGGGDRHPR